MRSIRNLLRVVSTSVAVLGACWSAQAHAQVPAGASSKSAEEGAQREADVIVTAQRREQSLQEVPVAVTAVSAEAMASSGLNTTEDLQLMTPGLVSTSVNGSSQTYIRGVGNQSSIIGGESSIATYIDGVYIASLTGAVFGFNNVERVEVLRGPQGTLFGRNATGGILQVITRRPEHDPSGSIGLSFGNYDTSDGSVYFTTGLSDTLAMNLAAYGTYQDEGFGKNIPFDDDINFRREGSVRGQLLFEPADSLSLLWSADYDRQRTDMGTNRTTLAGTRNVLGQPLSGTDFDATYNIPVFAKNSQWGLSQLLTLDLGSVELKSITAYREYWWNNIYDQDVTSARIVDVERDEEASTVQQEFLLEGTAGPLDWTTGLFYFRSNSSIQPISTQSSNLLTFNFARFAEQDLDSYAGFAQGTMAVTGTLNLTAGVRYTHDEATLNGRNIALPGHPAGAGTVLATVTDRDISASKVTWRLAADYRIVEDVMIYASASRGFKSGGFNLSSITQIPTQPETLDAYEVGIKPRLAGGQLQLNVAAFRYDYTDIQLSRVGDAGIQTLNAAEAKVNGAELEMTIVPDALPQFKGQASLSYLDAEYESFANAPYFLPNPYSAPPAGVVCPAPSSASPGGNTQCVTDASGNTMIRSPRWTAGLNLSYAIPISFGEIALTANYYYNDGFFWEPSNRLRQDAFSVVNAELALTTSDEAWRLKIFGRNLGDELYYSSVSEQALGDIATVQAPRTYGIGVDYRWGAGR